jgi:hypothetical protein
MTYFETITAKSGTHGDFLADVTLQLADTDVSDSVPVPVKTPAFVSSASVTRPADQDAYAALDVIGADPSANISFTSVGNIQAGHIEITGASVLLATAAIPSGMTTFAIHLFDAAPTALANNAAFNVIAADRSKYLGSITTGSAIDLGDTLYASSDSVNMVRKLATSSTTLYGVLQTTGAFTPGEDSTAITVKLFGKQC